MIDLGRMKLRFRRRLVVAVTAVTVITLGGALAMVARTVNASQEQQLDDALLIEAREEAAEAAALGGMQLQVSDRPGPAPDDIGHLTKYAAIYDPAGKALAATSTFRGRPPLLESKNHLPERCFDLWFAREHLRSVVVPVPGHAGTLLLLAAPRFDLDRDAAFLNRATLLVLLVAVLWAGGVTAWVVSRFTRGHEAIASVARRVAGGDFSARVDLHSSDQAMIQLADDVNRMIERLATLFASQRGFIAHAAHELRSPLTTLYGELSHALRRPRDGEAYRLAIEEALDSTRRLTALAEDLLALARIGASSEDESEPLSLRNVVEAAVSAVANEAATQQVTVRLEGASRLISGRCLDLERLFRNLLENAIRHSPSGGTVAATLKDENESAVVLICDEGPGIDELDGERIFEPFFRGSRETARNVPGVGLGLAIARKIAQAHRGDVTLGPRRSRGAQFMVRLPTSPT